MKSALLLLSGTAFAALLFLSGAYAVSAFMTSGEPHTFAHIDDPLWTFEPTYLDRANMTLREAKVKFAGSETVSVAVVAPVAGASQKPEEQAADLASSDIGPIDTAHVEWCMARYRSYRVEDDTYKPYGGQRRTCKSPYTAGGMIETVDMMQTGSVQSASLAADMEQAADFDTASWCRQQYRSYRASDNTYQPFSGPRRACVPMTY